MTAATQSRCRAQHSATLKRGKRRVKAKAYETCATCGEKRPEPTSFKYMSRAQWERDPFCSSTCCREAHGTPVGPQTGYGIDYGATKAKRAAA